MILACAILYAFALFLINSTLKGRDTSGLRPPLFLPQGALIKGGGYIPIVLIAWVLALIIASAAIHLLDPETEAAAEIVIVFGELLLIGHSMLWIRKVAGSHVLQEEEPEGAEAVLKKYPYLMLIGEPQEIIALKGIVEVEITLVETPYENVMLAPSGMLDAIKHVTPYIQVLPWTEKAQAEILLPYAAALESLNENIEKTMVAEGELHEEKAAAAALRERLRDTERSVSTLSATLQEMRLKGNALDYTRMTEGQREEERRRLEESLRNLEQLAR